MGLDETEKVRRVLKVLLSVTAPTYMWEGTTMRTKLQERTGFARDEITTCIGVLVRLGVISVQPAYGIRGCQSVMQWCVHLPTARPEKVSGEWRLV